MLFHEFLDLHNLLNFSLSILKSIFLQKYLIFLNLSFLVLKIQPYDPGMYLGLDNLNRSGGSNARAVFLFVVLFWKKVSTLSLRTATAGGGRE